MSNPQSNHTPPVVCTDLTATIANGGTTSGEIDLRGTTLCGIHMPASFTGTSVTFQVSDASGGTFRTMYGQDGVTALSADITAGGYIPLEYDPYFIGVQFIKIVSNATETADRVLTLAVRPV